MEALSIVVPVYARPHALQDLLLSLGRSAHPARFPVPLIFSQDRMADGSIHEEVRQLVKGFHWPHGPKEHIEQPMRFGLREHLLWIGDMTTKRGPLVVLEDDLTVSPYLIPYALAAWRHFGADKSLGAMAMCTYHVAESCYAPFEPLDDGSDVFLLQSAPSWGQLWWPEAWRAFREWLQGQDLAHLPSDAPPYLRQWAASSWKRWFSAWLAASGRTCVYPRLALSTTSGLKGVHEIHQGLFETPLKLAPRDWRFAPTGAQPARYDAYYEPDAHWLQALCPELADYDFSVDLYGVRSLGIEPYVLSTQRRAKRGAVPRLGWDDNQFPAAQNIVFGRKGTAYGLYAREEIQPEPLPFGSWRDTRYRSLRKAATAAWVREELGF
jgi:hypothetical protein